MLVEDKHKFELYWKTFNQRIFIHKIKCEDIKC